MLLLVGVNGVDEASTIAEQCRGLLAEPYFIGDDRFDLTASVGVAVSSSRDLSDDLLLQRADIALHEAKSQGANRVEMFDAALAEAARSKGQQRQLLRDALETNRLVMHFQPLVDTKSLAIVGYEALARVRGHNGELLGPSHFLGAAFGTALMWDLDRAGFVQACATAALLAKIDPPSAPYVACNFSPVSLSHPNLVEFVLETVRFAGIEPSQIGIELTETAAFDYRPGRAEALSKLELAGFRLALDDFGTGYSSLAHLRDLPISTVKVDRSFICKLTEERSARVIVGSVVALSAELGLQTVAEGVETAEELEQCRRLGFDMIQGWYFAPALSAKDCLQRWADQVTR